MPYTPPSSSGISFVFGGAGYAPPSPNGISFVFSQGGAPVRGGVAGLAEFSVVVTGGAPVNGAVTASPVFSAVASFAPVASVTITDPFSVFAYKVPDVTGTSAVKMPFVVTAARSAGAFIVAPLAVAAIGNHGLQAEMNRALRLSCVATAKVGRAASAALRVPFAVTAGAALPIDASTHVTLPLTVAATGRNPVRGAGLITAPLGVAGAASVRHEGAAVFTAPINLSASATVRQEGAASFALPLGVSADNSNARVGAVSTVVRFAAIVTGRVGTTGAGHVQPAFSVASVGASTRVGHAVAKLFADAHGSGGHGVAGQTSAQVIPLVCAKGRHAPLVAGTGGVILPFRASGSGGRPLTRHVGGSYVTTRTERMAVFR